MARREEEETKKQFKIRDLAFRAKQANFWKNTSDVLADSDM